MLTQLCSNGDVPAQSRFVLADNGDAWQFRGTLTFDNVSDVYASSKALALPAKGVVDLGGLVHADSSALAVLLGLSRRAAAEDHPLTLAALPEPLRALARVYGIEELLAPRAGSRTGVGS